MDGSDNVIFFRRKNNIPARKKAQAVEFRLPQPATPQWRPLGELVQKIAARTMSISRARIARIAPRR